MKLKHLESAVQSVEPFSEPKIALEQYATSPHLAARMIFTAHGLGDIEGRRVCDLGCGCAMLSICAELMGADNTTGVDVDGSALVIARRNCERVGVEVEFLLHDVPTLVLRPSRGGGAPFDTIITNPPFGTRVHGVDMAFVQAGLRLAARAVYSLHQSSTRDHILRKARQWGVTATVVAEMRFDLPATYKFHKDKSRDIAVDMIHFRKPDDVARLPPPLPKPGSVRVSAGEKELLEPGAVAAATAPMPPPEAGSTLAAGAADDVAAVAQLGALQIGAEGGGAAAGVGETVAATEKGEAAVSEVLYDCENDCGFYGTFSAVEKHEASCTYTAPNDDGEA